MRLADPRVQRTRALLRSAALELAAERELDEITVADIAARAAINRATVYQHYRDRDELLIEAMQDELGNLSKIIARWPMAGEASVEQVPDPIVELFVHVSRNAKLYRRLLEPNGSSRVLTNLGWVLFDGIKPQIEAMRPDAGARVTATEHASFRTGALMGLIDVWLREPEPRQPADIAAISWHLMRGIPTD